MYCKFTETEEWNCKKNFPGRKADDITNEIKNHKGYLLRQQEIHVIRILFEMDLIYP